MPISQGSVLEASQRKGNISIEKGIRSKVKCRSSAHFPPIWIMKGDWKLPDCRMIELSDNAQI